MWRALVQDLNPQRRRSTILRELAVLRSRGRPPPLALKSNAWRLRSGAQNWRPKAIVLMRAMSLAKPDWGTSDLANYSRINAHGRTWWRSMKQKRRSSWVMSRRIPARPQRSLGVSDRQRDCTLRRPSSKAHSCEGKCHPNSRTLRYLHKTDSGTPEERPG